MKKYTYFGLKFLASCRAYSKFDNLLLALYQTFSWHLMSYCCVFFPFFWNGIKAFLQKKLKGNLHNRRKNQDSTSYPWVYGKTLNVKAHYNKEKHISNLLKCLINSRVALLNLTTWPKKNTRQQRNWHVVGAITIPLQLIELKKI